MTAPPAAAFTACIRPDCKELPRYCSVGCAWDLEGPPGTIAEACELLRRASHQLALNMDDSQVLNDIGRFLARRAGR